MLRAWCFWRLSVVDPERSTCSLAATIGCRNALFSAELHEGVHAWDVAGQGAIVHCRSEIFLDGLPIRAARWEIEDATQRGERDESKGLRLCRWRQALER